MNAPAPNQPRCGSSTFRYFCFRFPFGTVYAFHRFFFLFPGAVVCNFVFVNSNLLFGFLSQRDCVVRVSRLDHTHTQGYYWEWLFRVWIWTVPIGNFLFLCFSFPSKRNWLSPLLFLCVAITQKFCTSEELIALLRSFISMVNRGRTLRADWTGHGVKCSVRFPAAIAWMNR